MARKTVPKIPTILKNKEIAGSFWVWLKCDIVVQSENFDSGLFEIEYWYNLLIKFLQNKISTISTLSTSHH